VPQRRERVATGKTKTGRFHGFPPCRVETCAAAVLPLQRIRWPEKG
jgi:hypothetical protein